MNLRLFFFFLLIFNFNLVYALEAPRLQSTIQGTSVNLSWNTVEGAEGYHLLYAPYPYQGENTIYTIDMGSKTALNTTLWEGAAFYVTIQTYDAQSSSGYSNIELIKIEQQVACSDVSGTWEISLSTDCGGTQPLSVTDTGVIEQLECQLSYSGENGGSLQGDINGKEINFTGSYNYSGVTINAQNGAMVLQEDGILSGNAETDLKFPGCSSTAIIEGIRIL